MSIKIKIDDNDISEGLRRLQKLSGDTNSLMGQFAGMMATDTANAFNRQEDPATGEKWMPLSPSYRALRIQNNKGESILDYDGGLRNSIKPTHGDDFAMVSTNKPYAAIHQFGGKTRPHVIRPKEKKALSIPRIGVRKSVNHPGSVIPARPYFGVSDWQLSRMRDIIVKAYTRALTK